MGFRAKGKLGEFVLELLQVDLRVVLSQLFHGLLLLLFFEQLLAALLHCFLLVDLHALEFYLLRR